MGKIRVKTLGIEDVEKQEAKEVKKRQAAKETKKMAKGAHGGERVVSMAPTEEEIAKEIAQVQEVDAEAKEAEEKKEKKAKKTAKAPRVRGKRYQDQVLQVDRSKLYALSDAVVLLKKFGSTKFDGTVELHINTTEKGVSGQVSLPHGTGKKRRVVVADPADAEFDKLIADIEKGNLEFDVLIATPAAMAKLARVAKILGPRGLMPNPKSGTISDKPKELAAKFEAGALSFRTETQAPIIHAVVGKLSFEEKNLVENVGTFLKAVGNTKVKSATIKSTMSPGIKLDISTLS